MHILYEFCVAFDWCAICTAHTHIKNTDIIWNECAFEWPFMRAFWFLWQNIQIISYNISFFFGRLKMMKFPRKKNSIWHCNKPNSWTSWRQSSSDSVIEITKPNVLRWQIDSRSGWIALWVAVCLCAKSECMCVSVSVCLCLWMFITLFSAVYFGVCVCGSVIAANQKRIHNYYQFLFCF